MFLLVLCQFSGCSLPVHCLFSVCSPAVNSLFSSCSCLFSACSKQLNTMTSCPWSCLNLWVHCDYVTSRPIECSNQKVKGFPSVKGLMGNDCKWLDNGLSAESAAHLWLDEGGAFNAVFSWMYTGHQWTLVQVSCWNMWLFHVITMCTVVISVALDLSSTLNKMSYLSGLMSCFTILFVQFHRHNKDKYSHPTPLPTP